MSAPSPQRGPELELARSIVDAVHAQGGRALFVGGWVRDRLRGCESKDIDLEVYGVDGDRLRTLA